MAAVAEISKPDTAVMFTAYREDLRLVKVQRYPILGQAGQKVGEHPGEAVQFRDHMLRVTDEGMPLEGGGFVAREEALAWLRGHRLYDDAFEGFREVQQAAPPVSEQELSAMMAAVWDEEALVAIIGEEESGWRRDALLKPAGEALGRLREAQAAWEAQQAAEVGGEAEKAPKRAAKRAAG